MSKVRSTSDESLIRIGELARRAGVPAATLRAWERRYAIVEPVRGPSGYRLYSPDDERRLRSMLALIDHGLAPAEAAARVLSAVGADAVLREQASAVPAPGLRAELFDALLRFDNAAAEQIMDRALAVLSADAFVREIALPVLRRIGDGWSEDTVTVGQEHFASNVLRGRMLGLARGWGGGSGRLALLACPPGEHHDLGLVGFGVALRGLGWRVTFLGADSPIDTIVACAEEIEPDVVVLSSISEELLARSAGEFDGFADRYPLMLAGPGASGELAARYGAAVLTEDPVAAAASLAP
ncbi:MAG: MerR family transcriptional regulator [Solirubrobacterales bacterium]|nr:MerR family transcriptional regulator [Solirubrobacterales bacterium]